MCAAIQVTNPHMKQHISVFEKAFGLKLSYSMRYLVYRIMEFSGLGKKGCEWWTGNRKSGWSTRAL